MKKLLIALLSLCTLAAHAGEASPLKMDCAVTTHPIPGYTYIEDSGNPYTLFKLACEENGDGCNGIQKVDFQGKKFKVFMAQDAIRFSLLDSQENDVIQTMIVLYRVGTTLKSVGGFVLSVKDSQLGYFTLACGNGSQKF